MLTFAATARRIALLLLSAAALLVGVAHADDTGSKTLGLRLEDAASRSPSPMSFGAGYTNARLEVLKVASGPRALRPLRRIQYSTDQIVIIARSASGEEKNRTVMIDPRLVRAENFTDDSVEATTFYRSSVDFSVSIPADAAIASVHIFKPRWTGSEWQFDALAEVAVK